MARDGMLAGICQLILENISLVHQDTNCTMAKKGSSILIKHTE